MKRGISTNRNVTNQASCLKQLGIDFAFRYYSQTTQQPEKRLTQAEAEALSAAGVQIGVVYEDAPTSLSYFSGTRGHQDAVNAYNAALSLHQLPGSAIYFAIDYDAALADISGSIFDYFKGVDQGMRDASGGNSTYLIGIYGSGAACDFNKTYAAWDLNQAIATTDLCGFSADEYEENQALDNFGGFILGYVPPSPTT